MAGHSRQDGVASLAYVPAIHVLIIFFVANIFFVAKTWMPATSAGMTWMGL